QVQGLARALRDAHPQAADRHHRPHAQDRRLPDAPRPSGRCRHRDQALRLPDMTIERNVKGLLGTKLGMTQVWDENNRVVPVTVVAASTNVVTQIRNPEADGYNAIQVGFGEIAGRKVTKPVAGQFTKAGTTPRKHLVEIRTALATDYTVGQELPVDTFA